MLKNTVKKKIILGIFIFPIICFGKNDSIFVKKNKWEFTIKFGAIRSNTSVTGKFVNQYTKDVLHQENTMSFKPGFILGANVEYYVLKRDLSVESGINFFTSTFAFTEIEFSKKSSSTPEITREEKTMYLTPGYACIPLNLKYYFLSKNSTINRGFIYAGTYAAILIEKDAYDYLKPFDFGLTLGIGSRFFENIILGANYCYGLSNVAQKENFTAKTNSLLQITLEYKFRFD